MQNISKKTNSSDLILNSKRKGFTLIELIVVIAIIGILVLLAMPKFMDYTRDAKDAKAQHDARVADDAVTEHLIGNDDKLPEGLTGVTPEDIQDAIEDGKVYDTEGPVAEVPEGLYVDVTEIDEVKKSSIKTDGRIISSNNGDVFVILDRAIRTDVCVLRADQKIEDAATLNGYTNPLVQAKYPDADFYEYQDYVFIREMVSGSYRGSEYDLLLVDYIGSDDNLIIPGFVGMRHVGGQVESWGAVTAIDDAAFIEKSITIAELPCTITGTMASDSGGTEICLDMTAQEATDAGFQFDGAGTITGYSGTATDVEIPCMIDAVEVVAIGNGAFFNKNLTQIIIPNSVTTIGLSAFRINQLTDIVIPNSVTLIGNDAFRDNQLTSATIPSSVVTIGDYSFYENQLTEIIIPEGVSSIGLWAFKENQLSSLIIPSSVVTIKDEAFRGNILTDLTINNGITTIGYTVFADNQLTHVEIPDSMTSISNRLFSRNNISSVNIGNNITSIGSDAFIDNILTEITIPASLTTMSGYAFTRNGPEGQSNSIPTTGPWAGTWSLNGGDSYKDWQLQ